MGRNCVVVIQFQGAISESWCRRCFQASPVEALAASGSLTGSTAINPAYVRVHRSTYGGKGGEKPVDWPPRERSVL